MQVLHKHNYIEKKKMIPPISKAQRMRNMQEYFDAVRRLKQQSCDQGMLDKEFKKLYHKTLDSLTGETYQQQETANSMKRKKYVALLVLSLALIVVTANYQVIYSCTASNLQDYIYPGLRQLRTYFIPLLEWFNCLTGFYQELCLLENPFYTVADMDCWPCSILNSVIEVHDPHPVNKHHLPPYVFKTEQEVITPNMLKDFYMSHRNVLDKAPSIRSDNKIYIHPIDMIRQQESGENHYYVWKINNINAAKTFRQIIPRPQIVPKFGQSTERYLIVDTRQEKFKVPDTECNFSFLLSLSGSRAIELKPAEECQHQCQPLKLELKQSYLLWYNWWYWRPIVQPSTENITFIAYVGSYC